MRLLPQVITTLLLLRTLKAAPVDPKQEERRGKSLAFLDYMPEIDYSYEVDSSDYDPMTLEENDLSRTIPTKQIAPQAYNSPIYYIRMPPQPYVLVPGLGYVSQAPPNPMAQMTQFVNVPMSFVANGKPNSIYQWSGAFGAYPTPAPPPMPVPKPQKPPKKPMDSKIHRLPGKFTFNGKPENILVLSDSYNSLYSDVLQSVYP